MAFRDLWLYYAHGRWYNPDTGLFLSPDDKGDYFYGGAGQDPVNDAWAYLGRSAPGNSPNTLPPAQFGTGGLKALEYKDSIKRESLAFGIPWQILAGVLESEIQLDTFWDDAFQDFGVNVAPWMANYFRNPGPGIGNVHILTAKSTAYYLNQYYMCQTCANMRLDIDPNESNESLALRLLNADFTIRVMAAHVRQLADYRFGSNGRPWRGWKGMLSGWYLKDAVAVWHGYRYGVPNVSPQSPEYGFRSLEEFQDRGYSLEQLINEVVQGVGAKESAEGSRKYFEAYWSMGK